MTTRKLLLAFAALLISGTLHATTPQKPAKKPDVVVLYAVKQRPVEGETPAMYDLLEWRQSTGKEASLFALTPLNERPLGRIEAAKVIKNTTRVIIVLSHTSKAGSGSVDICLLDKTTGKIVHLAQGLYWDYNWELFLTSYDRRSAFFYGKTPDKFKIWNLGSKMHDINGIPKGCVLQRELIRWPIGSSKPTVRFETHSNNKKTWYWMDTGTGKLQPIKQDNLAINADDFAKGKYLRFAKAYSGIELARRGCKPIYLASSSAGLNTNSAYISPDGRYVIWHGYRGGEGMDPPACGEDFPVSYFYDITHSNPEILTTPLSEQCGDTLAGFINWGRNSYYCFAMEMNSDSPVPAESIILRVNLPSMAIDNIYTVPKDANFMDLIEN